MKPFFKLLLICTVLSFTAFSAHSQTERDTLLTLEQRFSDLLRQSENFKEYKVVRRSTLNLFWAALNDSVSTSNAELKAALISKMELQTELNEKSAQLEEAEAKLALLEGEGARVTVLGIDMSQSFYHTLLWCLMLAFAGLMSFFLFQYQRGNVLVKETQGEHEGLQKQFDDLRHKSKETQMKLKRELQTALNRLETVERG